MAGTPILGVRFPQVTVRTSLNFSDPQNLHILSSFQYVFQILAKGWPPGYFASLRRFHSPSRVCVAVDVANKTRNRQRLLSPLNIPKAPLVNLTALFFLEVWEMASPQHPTCPILYAHYNQRTGRSLP